MKARELFLSVMSERRTFPAGSIDHEYLTRAARKYVWMMRGIPSNEWNAK